MKQTGYLFLAIMLFLAACGNNEHGGNNTTDSTATSGENKTMTTPSDFKEVYSDFFSSIIDDNSKTFNSYIHPEHGLYIIESKGGVPVFEKVTDISFFRSSTEKKSIFDINKSKIGLQMIEEELPTVNCDSAGFYTKRGCFTNEENTFKDSKLWDGSGLDAAEKDKVNKVAQTIVKTIINTANYRYYFSKIEDRWYITFIDMRKPCNA